jgi:hypothetical protein
MRGEDIQLLHNELQSLNYNIPQRDIERSYFGRGTHQCVVDFQRRHCLNPSGVVDARTAHAINAAMEAQRPVPEEFIVSGHVYHEDETPLERMIVRAFDVEMRNESQLGEDVTTDKHGAYEIQYTYEGFKSNNRLGTILILQLFRPEDGLLVESKLISNAKNYEVVDFIIDPQKELMKEDITKHIERVQRINPIRGHYDKMRELIKEGLDSAQAIVKLGPSDFVGSYSGKLGGDDKAYEIWEKANKFAAQAEIIKHVTLQLSYLARYDDDQLSKEELRDLVELLCKDKRLLRSFMIYFAMKDDKD